MITPIYKQLRAEFERSIATQRSLPPQRNPGRFHKFDTGEESIVQEFNNKFEKAFREILDSAGL
jgi:hypothetical protein